MGLNFSSLYNLFFSKRSVKVLMLGLDNAGKSTILYKLKLNDFIVTIPTIGFNVEMVEYKNLAFTIWDIGGQWKIRPLWKHYYNNNDALIFVIDSNDPDRIEEARDELHSMLSDDQLRDTTVLILANKQDLPCAMNVTEVTEKLGMSNFRNRKWYVQGMSAVRGDGLYEGLDWLAHNLPSK